MLFALVLYVAVRGGAIPFPAKLTVTVTVVGAARFGDASTVMLASLGTMVPWLRWVALVSHTRAGLTLSCGTRLRDAELHPPEYAGYNFSLYIHDPGDVACCSNILSVTQPVNSGTAQAAATTTDGVWSGQHGEGTSAQPATWTQQVVAGNAAIQTLNGSGSNIFNRLWIRFDISVPSDYASGANPDINAANPSTWFWNLNYQTQAVSSDTITANLGFAGAPVHIVSG